MTQRMPASSGAWVARKGANAAMSRVEHDRLGAGVGQDGERARQGALQATGIGREGRDRDHAGVEAAEQPGDEVEAGRAQEERAAARRHHVGQPDRDATRPPVQLGEVESARRPPPRGRGRRTRASRRRFRRGSPGCRRTWWRSCGRQVSRRSTRPPPGRPRRQPPRWRGRRRPPSARRTGYGSAARR